MKIQIVSKRLEMTEPLKEYIEIKIGSLDKFLARYEEEGEVLANVEISRTTSGQHKGDVFYAEINIQLPGKLLRAEDTQSDARAAIDSVKNIMKNELVKYKEKTMGRN